MNSYIGICDFENDSQVRDMLSVWSAKDSSRRLMVGCMASYKSLNGLPTKWSEIWPAKESLSSIFIDDPRVMNCIHYADCEGIDILDNLEKAVAHSGPNLHAVQLDMIWPSPCEIEDFHRSCWDVSIVLQLNFEALCQVNNNEDKLLSKLDEYDGCLDYILLDLSGGKGIPLDAQILLPYVRAISKSLPNIGVSVAGGLGPVKLNGLKPLLEEFPSLSFDAQSKLRQSGSAIDPINWDLARRYLIEAQELLGGC